MTKGFYHTDVIDIVTSVNGGSKCRMHFQLTTESITAGGLTTITYNLTNYLDSNCMIYYLTVNDQLFPFDSGINPGNIGTVKFSRNGSCVPTSGSVFVECGNFDFDFGPLCTAILNGDCSSSSE